MVYCQEELDAANGVYRKLQTEEDRAKFLGERKNFITEVTEVRIHSSC